MTLLSTKPDGYMTLKEFAQASGRDFRTINRWLAEGKIVGVFDSHAKKWLISKSEFERIQKYGIADGRRKKQAL